MNEPPNDDATEHYQSYAASALGWAALRVDSHGAALPVPEHEALASAIPMWVTVEEHADDALALCLEFAGHEHPAVRAAAVTAIGDLALRHGRLEQPERAAATLARATRDEDVNVADAASRSLRLVRDVSGGDVA